MAHYAQPFTWFMDSMQHKRYKGWVVTQRKHAEKRAICFSPVCIGLIVKGRSLLVGEMGLTCLEVASRVGMRR